MARPAPPAGRDAAFAATLRAGPKPFADQLHERVSRLIEEIVEEGLDTRGAAQGWATLSPLRPDGRRP